MPGISGTLRYCFLGRVSHIHLGYGSDVLQGLGSQMYLKATKCKLTLYAFPKDC